MKKKSKGRKEIEQMIVRGHRLGVCDSEGNSVDSGGVPVAKPKHTGYVTFRKVYPRGGTPYIVEDNR